MIVRKLRLQRAWSQETLAELTGLSVRTIQRAERGQKMSLETARSLASVFEVKLSTFHQGETTMNDKLTDNLEVNESSDNIIDAETLQDDEKEALEYVKGIKEFYTHAFMYVVFIFCFLVFKPATKIDLFWPFIGWGIGVVAHGIMAFELIRLPFQNWEKKAVEKRLGRKL